MNENNDFYCFNLETLILCLAWCTIPWRPLHPNQGMFKDCTYPYE